MKKRWKSYFVLMIIWMLFPFLTILAIQERGTLMVEKKESIEEILPLFVAVSIKNEFHQENIKAMAVIWRSNLNVLLKERAVSILEIKKCYGGLEREAYIKEKNLYEKAFAACKETEGEILTYQGEVCYCPFFDFGSGKTRDAFEVFEENSYPYLIAVPSYKDEMYENYLSYYYFTTDILETVDWNDLNNVILGKGTERLILHENNEWEISGGEYLQILERDSSDYVTWIKVKDQVVGGDVFRRKLRLSSSCFSIEQQGNQIRIICEGRGHGFGYSQYGGNSMANEGKEYKSLLHHFFPQLHIEKSV